MPSQLWTAPASPLQDGASVSQNTFTAARDLPIGTSTGAMYAVPGNSMQPGSYITVDAWGVLGNAATTPTLILGVYWGGVAGVALAVSTAKTLTTGATNWPWELHYRGRIITPGATGSMIGQGNWHLPTSLTAWTDINLPETVQAAVTIDTTIQKTVTIGATWSVSSSANAIFLHGMLVRTDG